MPSYTPALPVLGPYVFPLPISLLPSSLTQASALVSPTPPHPAAPLTPAPPLQAQRNNEDISIITPLFTVSVDHRVSGLKRLAWAWEIASTQQASYFGGGGQGPIPPLSLLCSPFLQGTWNGPWVSTEVLAAVIGIVIYYLAFNAKSHIQA